METFDVLDCSARKTGELISRDDAHRLGAWHGAFHCLVVYAREGTRYALFQKRSAAKKIAPGRYDVSVGGHYSSGEDAHVAGPREINEELGLTVEFEQLLPLGRRIFVYCFTPGVVEYEFQDVFLFQRPVQPSELRLQEEEVDAVLEVELGAGIELFSGRSGHICASILRSDGKPVTVHVRAEEFVPCLDNYYLKLLLLAQRYFSGERRLLCI